MDVLVLCGGLSEEREVSVSTGAMVANTLRAIGHRTLLLDMSVGSDAVHPDAFSRDHTDIVAAINKDAPASSNTRSASRARLGTNVLEYCKLADLVFLALHGKDGEDGKIQATLDLLAVKYTGTGAIGSTIAMNKNIAKQILKSNGIRTPRGVAVTNCDINKCEIGFPCVVKPCSGGSSVGTSVVHNSEAYTAALELALQYDSEVLVEEYIQGRELNVGVLAGRALPVIEICTDSGFFDYANKYQSGLADERCPADLPESVTKTLQDTALRVFKALKFEVYGRMDFILDKNGKVWCLEGNTLPGLTATSLFPQEAQADGISFEQMCSIIVQESLKKYTRCEV